MTALVLTAGETMALLDPAHDGPIRLGSELTLRLAGAESNFAIALARLDIPVVWVSRLGADPLGMIIRDALAREGVDTRFVQLDPKAQTGIFFKWRSDGRSNVVYYRGGSAASGLRPDDVPEAALDGVELVHLTGITMALGDSPRSLVLDLAARASERDATVIFDPNYRPSLWPSAADALVAQREVLPSVDWYLCGFAEGCELFGVATAAELFDAIRSAGAKNAVIRIGPRGALVCSRGGIQEVPPVRTAHVRDEVGAGDAFAGGFAYGLLQAWSPHECAWMGNLIAASALCGTGDWETLPQLSEIEQELASLAHGEVQGQRTTADEW
jgi:2-dehydro-3-deoxygluconokinase